MTENQQARKKLQDELRKLFQFDVSDLDFGIYRILNRKKDQIEHFIEKDLLDAVNEGLKEYQQQDASQVDEIKQQIIENLSDDAFDKQGNLVKYESTKLGKEYLEALEKAERQEVGADTEKKIYNDLFTFFSRYYDNGDFLSKRRISTRDSKYAVPYNGEEVLLHWANKDQYYIKTGEQFTSFKFELDGGKKSVWFKVAQAETEKDNVKEEESRSFVLRSEDPIEVEDDELTLWFEYRPLTDEEEEKWLNLYKKVEKPRKTVDRSVLCVAYNEFVLNEVDKEWRDLLSVIPKNKDRSILYQKLNHYTGKNTTDYFIHKDLKSFLERELEYYLKNEVIRVDDFIEDQSQQAMEVALTRARVVRQIGKKIIAFLSQIENFQKKLFEKKKFVVDTHYCFTLDKVPEDLYDTILENKDQLQSWEELYAMKKWDGELQWDGKWTKEFLQDHPFMMVDTQFFDDDFKYDVLSKSTDIDENLNGILVNSENYQALNQLKTKFKGKINLTYIDPPYNTGEDDFIYKDNYQHSSWLSLMADRIKLAKELISKNGVHYTSIGDDEEGNIRLLLDSIFKNQSVPYLWKSRAKPTNAGEAKLRPQIVGEFVFQNQTAIDLQYHALSSGIERTYQHRDEYGEYRITSILTSNLGRYRRETMRFEIDGYVPPDDKRWKAGYDEIYNLFQNNRLGFNDEGEPYKKVYSEDEEEKHIPLWTFLPNELTGTAESGKSDLSAIVGKNHGLDSIKPKELIIIFLNVLTENDDYIMDYFAGSGTTGHATISINKEDGGNRRYILIELGKHFENILKPRIQKVVFSINWKDGIPQDKDGQSHAFKYHLLESYEDALNNIDFKNPEETQQAMEFEDYMLNYMLDFETQGVSATLLKGEAFDTPFDYQLNIQRGHGSPKPETVDMVETFHYLIGLWVQTLRRYEHQGRKYVVSKGQIRDEDAVEDVCIIWRNTKDLDLDKEAEWIQENITKDETFDRIYINGINKVKDAEPIELTFREKMFEDIA